MAGQQWFKGAVATAGGDDYCVDDIYVCSKHDDRAVAVYATAVRAGGKIDGDVLGTLGIYFDWQEQARVITQEEPMLSADEWERSTVLLLDAGHRIIAASDGRALASFDLMHGQETKGYYLQQDGTVVAFAKTIGYEAYDGLGWWGVILQRPEA